MSTEQAPIDVESTIARSEPGPAPQPMPLAIREQGGAVGQALPLETLKANLDFIKQVMQSVMKEGQDYGKIPGCGDKPCLMQPGAQKLLMTFQLTDHVKKEVLREYPNWHREYEFTVCVRSGNSKEWDGVGTCSTLESKYRYRKAERVCPSCGKPHIIIGKEEYGGGFLCWKKKGGCGSKFAENDQRITSQPTEDVENEDSADNWNTVRKMAFKRALVAAAINATNTSELWTQDLEERAPSGPPAGEYLPEQGKAPPAGRQQRQEAPRAASNPPASQRVTHTPPPSTPPTAAAKAPVPAPTEESRAKMITLLQANPGQPNREIVTEYFIKAEILMPNESLEDVPLRWVPATAGQMRELSSKLSGFGNGEQAVKPYPSNEEPLPPKHPKAALSPKPATSAASGPASAPSTSPASNSSAPDAGIEVPRDANCDPNSPDAPWRQFPMPWGKQSGTPLADLDKKYLYGLWANYEVETEYDGKPKRPETIAKDTHFRQMLDEAGAHYEFKKD